MGTSITKQGIASANITLGANLLTDTSNTEVQYTYPTSSYSDKFSRRTSIIPTASKYTLSFYAKSTVNGDKVRAHYYSPNTTTHAETSQGVTSTGSDGNIDFTLSTEWTYYWVVYTQSTTTSAKAVIFPRMFSQASGGATGTGIVSVKCVKFEKGEHPTPWVANIADTNYVDADCGFFETPTNVSSIYNGVITANQFYEL